MMTKNVQIRRSEYPLFTIKDNILHEGLSFIKDIIKDCNDVSYKVKYLQEGYSDTRCDYFNDWKTHRSKIMRKMRDLFDRDNEVLINIMPLESNYEKDSEEYKIIIDKFSEMKFEPISLYDDVNDSHIEILVFLNDQGKYLLEKIKEKNQVSQERITMEDIEQATYENFNEYNENY